jgi:hypothetical protein
MRTPRHRIFPFFRTSRSEEASLLMIVIWIAFGLVSITLYFAHSMTFEMRASDNRVAAVEAEQAIEGAARYISCVLSNLNVPGSMPDQATYQFENVPVGNAHFWIIGRGTYNQDPPETAHFGLVDECSKMNANYVSSNMLATLPTVVSVPTLTSDIIASILAWRSTNTSSMSGGAESDTYMRNTPPYLCKNSKFETVDELRLIYNMDMTTLVGEDANRNGIMDPNENDGDVLPPTDNKDGQLDPGIAEYLTVYSREPNTATNGATRYNITTFTSTGSSSGPYPGAFLKALTNGTSITAQRANQIIKTALGGMGRIRPGAHPFTSPLQFYISSGMSLSEIAQVEMNVRGTNVAGLINVNTASTEVLSCVPGLSSGQAAALTSYRQSNTNLLNGSIGWVTQVLPLPNAIQAGPWLTGKTYQYTADIAAVGHNGRGYRRVRFVFDTSQGAPIIRYRQDLTHLGWALGKQARNPVLAAK